MDAQTKELLIRSIASYQAVDAEERSKRIAYIQSQIDFNPRAWFPAAPYYLAAGAIFLRWARLQQCRIIIKWP